MRRGFQDSYIIWLGNVFTETAVSANLAISPAANRWQYGFLTSLQKLGLKICTIGHIPEPMWPKGRLLVRENSEMLNPAINGSLVSYYNLIKWREIGLARKYLELFQRHCKKAGKPTAIITYNVSPAFSLVTRYAQKELGIPYICVLADNVAPQTADGVVFLSWGYYNRYYQNAKLHLDGGVLNLKYSSNAIKEDNSVRKQAILYSGVMNCYGGIDFLVRGFHQVPKKDIELWICGKGISKTVEQISAIDSRVKKLGFVSEKRLKELSQKATIFVNPRPSFIPDNQNNFPSKILEYLSYGKPIISTWTEGLSPDYRNVLEVLNEESIGCMAQTIEDVLAWKSSKRQILARQIAEFLKNKKTWITQAGRFIQWMNREIFHNSP